MSTMTIEEIDAHLYALGITNDARGVSVLIIGNPDALDDGRQSLSDAISQRLKTFGAVVWWDHDSITHPDLRVDYVVVIPLDNAAYDAAKVIAQVLKPGGRYLVFLQRLAYAAGLTGEDDTVELTDVRQVGDGQIRAIGWKRRPMGEVV